MARRHESSSSSQGHSQRSPEIAHQAPVSRQVGTLIGHEHKPLESAQILHYVLNFISQSPIVPVLNFITQSPIVSPLAARILLPQLIRIFCRPPARMSRDGIRTPSPVREPGQDSRGSRSTSPLTDDSDQRAALRPKPRNIAHTGSGSSKLSSEI